MRADPNYGTFYGAGEAPSYITDEGVEVWMYRRNQRVRFFDRRGSQVGPEHANLYPAVIWAHAHGWNDPSAPRWLNYGCAREAPGEKVESDGQTNVLRANP
jgi:hypothetical protein